MGRIKIDDVCNLVRLAHVAMKKTNCYISVELNSSYGVAVLIKNRTDGGDFLEFFSVDPMECSDQDCKTYEKCREYLKSLISEVGKNGN